MVVRRRGRSPAHSDDSVSPLTRSAGMVSLDIRRFPARRYISLNEGANHFRDNPGGQARGARFSSLGERLAVARVKSPYVPRSSQASNFPPIAIELEYDVHVSVGVNGVGGISCKDISQSLKPPVVSPPQRMGDGGSERDIFARSRIRRRGFAAFNAAVGGVRMLAVRGRLRRARRVPQNRAGEGRHERNRQRRGRQALKQSVSHDAVHGVRSPFISSCGSFRARLARPRRGRVVGGVVR